MPKATNEITIDRPIEEVFAFLGDAENDTKWRSGVLDIKRVAGAGLGARVDNRCIRIYDDRGSRSRTGPESHGKGTEQDARYKW